jgi:hypothetical protein
MKHDIEMGPKAAAAEQDKAKGEKIETKIEARASLQLPSNRTVQFLKPDHPVSLGSEQKRLLRTTALETAPTPCWCPPELTPS